MKPVVILTSLLCLLAYCSNPRSSGLFQKQSPHDDYAQKIKKAGLDKTMLGRQWFAAAQRAIDSPLLVNLPYSETGYFGAEEARAAGLRIHARRGEKLTIRIKRNPGTGVALFLDLWEPAGSAGTEPRALLSADTSDTSVDFEVEREGSYILRLQPELLSSVDYTLSISIGPTLAFPVAPGVKSNISSFWGAGRDAGARKHEGIDIFAPRGAPVVAAVNGVVTRVNENRLGGRVIFLSATDKNYTLYYAHLQKQIAQEGQQVRAGDTLGLVGNSGNAVTTAPHLHFGIYTYTGAIDPLPFVHQVIKTPEPLTGNVGWVGKIARNTTTTKLLHQLTNSNGGQITLAPGTLLRVHAATANWFKVSLPKGEEGFVAAPGLTEARLPIAKATIKNAQPLFDQPHRFAAIKSIVAAGKVVNILGRYKAYHYVNVANVSGWISTNVAD